MKDKWAILDNYPSEGAFKQHNRSQHIFIYDDDDKLLVDFVGKLENIESDWKIVADRIGVSDKLPHINKSKQNKHYTEYYTTELRDLIARRYEKDIELFGYKFSD